MMCHASFIYTVQDFVERTCNWNQFMTTYDLSKFDTLLRSRWDEAMQNRYFRYNLDAVKSRRVPGKHDYILQLNLKRGTERRPPQKFESLKVPFDVSKFNFSKVPQEEIVCGLRNGDFHQADCNGLEASTDKDDLIKMNADLILINVSPAGYGHVLLVPEVNSNIPQKMTCRCIRLGIELILLSSHPGFRVGFNSLCALASINHQHLHGWYLDECIVAEHTSVVPIGNGCYETTELPCRAFVFQLHGTTLQTLTQRVFGVVNYLQENDVAHNVIMTRGVQFGKGPASSETTLRIYIWPRVSFAGEKKVMGETSVAFNVAAFEFAGHIPMFGWQLASVPVFNTAVAELAGFIPMYDADMFESLTEEMIEAKIRESSLTEEDYDNIRCNIAKILDNLNH